MGTIHRSLLVAGTAAPTSSRGAGRPTAPAGWARRVWGGPRSRNLNALAAAAAAGLRLCLLVLVFVISAAPAARAAGATASPDVTGKPAASAKRLSKEIDPVQGRYAEREAQSPELAGFVGGHQHAIYIGSAALVVVLVILIVVLI
jgi:hypothetical protein